MGSHPTETPHPVKIRKRPFILSALCLFGWVYFFILSAVFLLGLIRSGWVTEALNLYTPVTRYSNAAVSLILGANALLHILSFAGIILMWNLRKYGYFIFGGSVLAISLYQLLMHDVVLSTTLVYIAFLVLFGLLFRHFRKAVLFF